MPFNLRKCGFTRYYIIETANFQFLLTKVSLIDFQNELYNAWTKYYNLFVYNGSKKKLLCKGKKMFIVIAFHYEFNTFKQNTICSLSLCQGDFFALSVSNLKWRKGVQSGLYWRGGKLQNGGFFCFRLQLKFDQHPPYIRMDSCCHTRREKVFDKWCTFRTKLRDEGRSLCSCFSSYNTAEFISWVTRVVHAMDDTLDWLKIEQMSWCYSLIASFKNKFLLLNC